LWLLHNSEQIGDCFRWKQVQASLFMGMAELEDDFGDDDIDEEAYADVGERGVRTLVLGDDTIGDDDDNEGEDDGDGDESDPLASGSDREIDAEHEELFGASVNTLLAERGRGRKKRRRPYGAIGSKRRVSEVPHHLTGVMGAATIAYMAKRFDEAELALLRVIKEAPKAVAPHRTLALISEERGDQKMSLTHLMSAVHLDRQDRDLWKRCAALSHELGEEDQAIYCLTNALKGTHGRDAEALQARGQLLSQAGLHRKAADSYIKLLKLLPGDLEVALSIAEMFDLSRILHKAEPFLQETIEYAERHPPRFEDRELFLRHEAYLAKVVQKLVELRFSQARYEDAAALLTRLQDRRSLGDLQTPFLQRVMLAICQHRSGTRALASVTFNEFFMTPDVIERHPKLMWHVAETCFEANDLGKACRAYSALLELEAYKNHVDVLLRRSEVLEELDRVEEADDDLRRILDITPGHVEATIRLARIGSESLEGPAFSGKLGNLKPSSRTARSKRGRAHRSGQQNDGESLVGLSGSSAKKTKAGVYLAKAGGVLSLAEKAYIDGGAQRYLRQLGPYLAAALHLQPFSLDGTDPLSPSEALGTASGSQAAKITKEADDALKPIGQALLRSLTDDEMVQLVERVIEGMAMLENGVMSCDAVDVLLGIARNRARTNRKLSKHILFLSLYVRLTRGDVEDAFDDIRALAKEWPSDNRLWFLCAKLDVFFGERGDSVLRVKIFRFLVRLVKRQDCVIPVVMAAAVFSARGLAGSYKPGLRLHARVSRGVPTCPLSALCIGTNMLYLSRSRTVSDRNEVTLKAFTYMDAYRRLRRAQFAEEGVHIKYFFELEIDYNIARAMHDLGIVHMAAELYMSILDRNGPPSCIGSNGSQTRIPPWINVKRDAAYNLLHILRQSGSVRLALAVMHEHLMF
jgi:tetratricopeptide (TPR) repeat protein